MVNSADEESEEVRKRMRSLRLYVNQTQKWHDEDRKEFNKSMQDMLKGVREQRRRSEEVKEKKALINQCLKRTKEVQDESRKVWEQILQEVKRLDFNERSKDFKLPMDLTELEKIELEEILCTKRTSSENSQKL